MWQWSASYGRGTSAHSAGRLLEAEINLRAALKRAEDAHLTNDCRLSTMQCLAWTYRKLNRLDEAETLCNSALAILDQPDFEIGKSGEIPTKGKGARKNARAEAKTSSDLKRWQAHFINILGSLRMADMKMDEARLLYERALDIEKEEYGDDHPSVTSVRDSLTALAFFQNDFAKAAALTQRSLAANEKLFGSTHSAVALTLQSLAFVYTKQDRLEEAEALYKRGLTLLEAKIDASAVAKELLAPSRFDGDNLQWRSNGIFTRALGEKNPILIVTLQGLAELYKLQKRYKESEQLHKRILSIQEQVHGQNHTIVADELEHYAEMLAACGREQEARALTERAEKIRLVWQ